MKENIKKEQPIFYQIVHNEFSKGKVPHAFLLVGDNYQDPLVFLAQSLFCEEIVSCETCNVCRRVENHSYPDIVRYGGEGNSIKKKDIVNIQTQMAKSSIEGRGQLYILEEIENSSKEAMNSLLKMLEEPQKDVYAIFTTKNLNLVLPTIISRCQVLNLRPDNKSALIRKYLDDKFSEEDAYILSTIFNQVVYPDNYQEIKTEAMNFIDDLYLKTDNLIINAQINVFNKYTSKDDIHLFLNILLLLLKDIYNYQINGELKIISLSRTIESYSIQKFDIIKMIEIVLEIDYQLSYNVNLNLLMDKLMYQLINE